MSEVDPLASDADVVQVPDDVLSVPVRVIDAVRTQELPARLAGFFTRTVTSTAERFLEPDPFRKSVTIYSFDQDIYFGVIQAQAMPGRGAHWPKGIPLTLTTSDAIWVATASTSSEVTFVCLAWAG